MTIFSFSFQASAFPLEAPVLKLVAGEPGQHPPGTAESVAAGNGAPQDYRAILDVEGAAQAATSKPCLCFFEPVLWLGGYTCTRKVSETRMSGLFDCSALTVGQ